MRTPRRLASSGAPAFAIQFLNAAQQSFDPDKILIGISPRVFDQKRGVATAQFDFERLRFGKDLSQFQRLYDGRQFHKQAAGSVVQPRNGSCWRSSSTSFASLPSAVNGHARRHHPVKKHFWAARKIKFGIFNRVALFHLHHHNIFYGRKNQTSLRREQDQDPQFAGAYPAAHRHVYWAHRQRQQSRRRLLCPAQGGRGQRD